MNMKYLVGSPESVHFLDLCQVQSGVRSMLGETDDLDAAIKPEVQSAHIELRHAAGKIAALAQDVTRTEVQRHAAAKKLAEVVLEKLSKTKGMIASRSEALRTSAIREADRDLGPTSDRAVLHSEIRDWVREQTRATAGLEKVRKAMADSDDLAAVLWHSPSFLLGVPDSIHEVVRFEALEARRPLLFARLSGAIALDKLAAKFEAVGRKVPAAFYNPEIAKQASRRVEV